MYPGDTYGGAGAGAGVGGTYPPLYGDTAYGPGFTSPYGSAYGSAGHPDPYLAQQSQFGSAYGPQYNTYGSGGTAAHRDPRLPPFSRLRPTYRQSQLAANPDFGNTHFRKGYTAEVTLKDGETVVLSAHSRNKAFRTQYSPLSRYSSGWLDRVLRFLWLDKLFGANVDSVKHVKKKSFVFLTAHVLPDD